MVHPVVVASIQDVPIVYPNTTPPSPVVGKPLPAGVNQAVLMGVSGILPTPCETKPGLVVYVSVPDYKVPVVVPEPFVVVVPKKTTWGISSATPHIGKHIPANKSHPIKK
jgi:hypothetical protein